MVTFNLPVATYGLLNHPDISAFYDYIGADNPNDFWDALAELYVHVEGYHVCAFTDGSRIDILVDCDTDDNYALREAAEACLRNPRVIIAVPRLP